MNLDKKEEVSYLVVMIVGFIHLYAAPVFNILAGNGKLVITIQFIAIMIFAIILSIIGSALYFMKRRGFSLLARMGIYDSSRYDERDVKCASCGTKISASLQSCTSCGYKLHGSTIESERWIIHLVPLHGLSLERA